MLAQLIAKHGCWAVLLPCSMQRFPCAGASCVLEASTGAVFASCLDLFSAQSIRAESCRPLHPSSILLDTVNAATGASRQAAQTAALHT